MSDAKTPKKAETVSKKSEPTKTESTKTEPTKTEAAKSEVANTENKSVDNSVAKSGSPPKSASQSSTSHFSSVSTPEYRSGWNNIFGGGGGAKKTAPAAVSKHNFPKKLNILDYDIDVVLRDALDSAFNDVAKKRGFNLKGAKEIVRLEYNLTCEIKEA